MSNVSNTMCNSTFSFDPSNRYLVSSVVYGLVLAVGLPLNTLSLWILLARHGLRSPAAVLMINLAASDILLAVSLPLRVYFYATLRFPLGAGACTAAILLYRMNIRMSCIFITLISVDRLLALVFPLRSRSVRTATFAFKYCALLWIISTVLSVWEGMQLHESLKLCEYKRCFEYQGTFKSPGAAPVTQAAVLLVLLMVNIVSTFMVIGALMKRPDLEANKMNNKMNVVLIFVINMMVFVVFFLPFALTLISKTDMATKRYLLRILTCLSSINCCLDPLIYYFSLDSFWQDRSKKQVDGTSCSVSRSLERL